jgi:hypothetical protein
MADQRQSDLDLTENIPGSSGSTRGVSTQANYDLGEGTAPTVTYNDLAQFTYGAAYTASQSFPVSLKERVSAGNLEYYAMDTYKPVAKATITYGMRVTWNTNVTSEKIFSRARPALSLTLLMTAKQPLNQVATGECPRPVPRDTAVRLPASGISSHINCIRTWPFMVALESFNDIIPSANRRSRAMNAPNDPTFVGGIGGQVGGIGHCSRYCWKRRRCSGQCEPFLPEDLPIGRCCLRGDSARQRPPARLAVSLNSFPEWNVQDTVLLPVQFRHVEQQIRIAWKSTRRTSWALAGSMNPTRSSSMAIRRFAMGAFAPVPVSAAARSALRERE